MRKLILTIAALGFASAMPALADEAKYGGQVKKIGAYEGEFVVKGSDVQLYVIKDHKAMAPSAGMKASVRLYVGSTESVVDLTPAGDKLTGKAAAPASGSVRAMVTLTEGDKEVGKAQYTVTAK